MWHPPIIFISDRISDAAVIHVSHLHAPSHHGRFFRQDYDRLEVATLVLELSR